MPHWYYVSILFMIVLVYFITTKLYQIVLQTYFIKNDMICYDLFLKNCIQVVSQDNYFMNYGLWTDSTSNLLDANHQLVDFLFQKANIEKKTNLSILDVGCGYGAQDRRWMQQLDSSNQLTAIDISQTQIDYAKSQPSIHPIHFQQGDATMLHKQFSPNQFDCIFNVESAFHYKDRQQFFHSVFHVLRPNGTFIISDIVVDSNYQPTWMSEFFLQRFSDFLHIPSINLITKETWKQNIESTGLNVIEYMDITDQTFIPYYRHFFEEFIKKKGLPTFLSTTLFHWFQVVQPFSYVVAVCQKIPLSISISS
jgi:2-polyprenyl-3-methyl-5-hydroxy-6-metoxy-1,4-benzoquinol methylase